MVKSNIYRRPRMTAHDELANGDGERDLLVTTCGPSPASSNPELDPLPDEEEQ